MKKSDVLAWLKKNQDERGIAHWKKRDDTPAGMKSHGIGLVKLRRFAKSVGRDTKLAKQLWKSKLHEMKIILPVIYAEPSYVRVAKLILFVNSLIRVGGRYTHS